MTKDEPNVPKGCELVPAAKLRTSDVIVTPAGDHFHLMAVEPIDNRKRVKLRSWVRSFIVFPHTKFVRVRRNRTITTRPDLGQKR